MNYKTLLACAIGSTALLATHAALADTSISTRSLYQQTTGMPGGGPDINDNQYGFTSATESSTGYSAAIDGGQRVANSWARLDPTTGSVKMLTYASSNSASGGITASWASAALGDTIRVNSSNGTATLDFTLRYDARLNTDGIDASSNTSPAQYPYRHTDSTFSLSASHTVIVENPCPYECSPTQTEELGHQSGTLWTYAEHVDPAQNGGSNVKYSSYQNFDGLARNETINSDSLVGNWNGVLNFSIVVPTNEDISLAASFGAESYCFRADSCVSSNDSSHSFYLGLNAVGGELVSQNGYGYTLGVSPVPEPESYAMLLAGLALLAATARRVKRA